jgi:hypothetical protein
METGFSEELIENSGAHTPHILPDSLAMTHLEQPKELDFRAQSPEDPFEHKFSIPADVTEMPSEAKPTSIPLSSLMSTAQDPKRFITNSPEPIAKTFKMIKNDNGDSYDGNLFNGKRSGYGDMIYGNGDIYIGNWENGLFSGSGQ